MIKNAALLVASGLMAAVPLVANAALTSTDGGLGVYDTTNNVTWTSNANLMETQARSFTGGASAFVLTMISDAGGVIDDTPNLSDPTGTYKLSASDFDISSGQMDYWGARAWVNYLNVTSYGGSNQWALPTTVDNNASNNLPPLQSSSQLAQLFYGGLGQVAGSSITTTHNANYSLFSNLESYSYWSGTEYSAAPQNAWNFSPFDGSQGFLAKNVNIYALAVTPGQVAPVPIPAAAWLMLSGLGGFGVYARRKRTVALYAS